IALNHPGVFLAALPIDAKAEARGYEVQIFNGRIAINKLIQEQVVTGRSVSGRVVGRLPPNPVSHTFTGGPAPPLFLAPLGVAHARGGRSSFGGLGAFGDDVDHSVDRVRPPHDRSRSAYDLDPLHVVQWNIDGIPNNSRKQRVIQ